MKKSLLITFLFIQIQIFAHAQSYFPSGNGAADLQSFSFANGQWNAVTPSNNTLGSNYYQGANIGFDANNYFSLVNPVSLNEFYFGRWAYGWQGWNRVWHSGNLNNNNSNFTANVLNSNKLAIGAFATEAKINLLQTADAVENKGLKMFYQGSWGTAGYASAFRFIDIASTEEGLIFELNAYGAGIGYSPPSYASPDKLYVNGNVGIGTNTPDAKLTVAGNIHSREVKVSVNAGADFVFNKNYPLKPLDSLALFINQYKHLPEIATAKQMENDGINLSEMNIKLLQKIEELTLYLIQKDKEVKSLEERMNALEAK
ncbi:hypothetical protein [Pedobacter alpinus]|uniref:Cell wall anchor protein n=1 Tax=Pedobacter alpinus TaxID=1590643 RepID=A0ABW5TUL5_9SPHI